MAFITDQNETWPRNLLTDTLQWSRPGLGGQYENYIPAEDELPPDWKGTLMYLLERLDDREQYIIMSCYHDGKNTKEIGTELGLTPYRVSQILHHALARLTSGSGLSMLQNGMRKHYEILTDKQVKTTREASFIAGWRRAVETGWTNAPAPDSADITKEALKQASMEDMDIEELNLTVRTYNCLTRSGIHTIGQLQAMSREDLRRVRNLGVHSVEEICTKLRELNLDTSNKEG